jgi:serine/threonine-protein kinase
MASGEVPALRTMLGHRYELTAEIGRGGCAVVFEAHDHRLGRAVAVKIPVGFQGDLTKIARFERESRVISAIHHPNVCAVLDNGTTPRGAPFLVMERLFGESLRTVLGRRERLGVADTLAIALQLLSAIDAVHAVGIIHRDIKPDNIILVGRGGCDPIVKLLDFGLCRRSHQGANQEMTMTAEGAIVGTPEYMAPEQVLGSKPDVRIDTYAVGVVMYEMLTGDRTFFAKTVREILSGVMNKRVRPIRDLRRDVPRSLQQIVAKAMSREPNQRFQTAAEFQEALCAVKYEMAAVARAAQIKALERDSSAPSETQHADWELPTARIKPARRPPPAPEPATRVRRETGPMQPLPKGSSRRVDSATTTGRLPLPPRQH